MHSRVMMNSPRRLTPSWRSQCFVCWRSTFPPIPIPAELTRTASPPKRSRCSATSRRQSSSLETSAATASAPSSSAAASIRSRRREASVSSYPSSRSRRAIARPIPDDPPVTSAAFTRATLEGLAGDRRTRQRRTFLSPRRRLLQSRRRRYCGRMDVDVTLTDLVSSGGCAAKYSAARLQELLRGFVPAEEENLLVGLYPADDAAVYRLDDERALVFTIDFFPPIVDDPDDFGTIAATNALNDVFAMGGTPLLALSVAAFPEELPVEAVRWMRTLNRDAADVLRRVTPNAVTDVTGFGLLGHAHELATRSGVRVLIDAERLPALDGALDAARSGITTAGTRNNRAYDDVEIGAVPPEIV